jgi:hypothetical protein
VILLTEREDVAAWARRLPADEVGLAAPADVAAGAQG